MDEKQTATIPVKATVTIQELSGGIYLVQYNGSSATATSQAGMHAEINKALGISPIKRERKPK